MSSSSLLPLFSLFAYHYRPDDPFTLSSGTKSPEYLDCRAALAIPMVLNQVCEALERLIDPRVKAVGGLTMGADPIAVGLSLRSLSKENPLNWFSVRKEVKGHGQSRQIEGSVTAGSKVCILEDVVTTGSSTIKAIRACRAAGLEVCQVLTLIDRQQDGMRAIHSEVGAWASVHSLYRIDDIRATARLQQNGC